MPENNNYETDVVVVGSGAAAYSAAITASENGSEVIMLEKASGFGGTTLRSGGGFWVPNNRFQKQLGIKDAREDALRYMARYSFPQLYDPTDSQLGLPENEYKLISAYYDNASEMVDFFIDIGALNLIQEINWTGKPQVDYMDHLPENQSIRGRVLYSKDSEGRQAFGSELVLQLKGYADKKDIKLFLNHRVNKVLINDNNQAAGVIATDKDGNDIIFKSKKAVIFGSGGYTHNTEMMLHFQRGPHFGGCSAPSNTGDFINIASQIGAKLGNMAGAFRAEIVLEQAIEDPNGVHNVFYIVGDSVLEVNRYGLRIMDEKRNYNDRTMMHFVWDPQRAEWTNMIVFLIYDKRTATLWQGFPPLPAGQAKADYIIEGQDLEELAKNIALRLKKIAKHTGGFSLDDSFLTNLKASVSRFNEFAEKGKDLDFCRGDFAYDREWTTFPPTVPGEKWPAPDSKNYTMYPLSKNGPYYAILLGAGTLDTNGGPVINEKAQVLNTDNKPIERLYGAGNCIASPTANAYWGAGSTIGPALTFGYIAGINAAKEQKL